MEQTISWLFKKAKLNENEASLWKSELYDLALNISENLEQFATKPVGKLIAEFNLEIIERICPNVVNYLKSEQIYDHLYYICFIINQGTGTPIHNDGFGPIYGLNIPILNCENTSTVYYKAKFLPRRTVEGNSESFPAVGYGFWADEESAVEVGRLDATVPHWLDVTAPHKAEVFHDLLRINCSIRFHDTIIDYLVKKYGKD